MDSKSNKNSATKQLGKKLRNKYFRNRVEIGAETDQQQRKSSLN